MLKKLLSSDSRNELHVSEQKSIIGRGTSIWPNTEEQCHICGGEWSDPLCRLPMDSPCAQ